EQRSRGVWRPSPGAVYPALQQLEDEGLISTEAGGARRTFQLTDRGRGDGEAKPAEGGAPWGGGGHRGGGQGSGPMRLPEHIGPAAMQVTHAGTTAQVARAKQILADTRRALYRILSEDETGEKE